MTDLGKVNYEKEIRAKVAEERRAYKAEWREKNREHINEYNRMYRLRKKLTREVKPYEQ